MQGWFQLGVVVVLAVWFIRRLEKMASELQTRIDALKVALEADTSVTSSASVLMTELISQLKEVLANGHTPAAQLQEIDAVLAGFESNTAALAAAVESGTPVEPPVEPVP